MQEINVINFSIYLIICYNRWGDVLKTYYDVQKFLRRFGIVTYIGNREAEIELSLIELKALKHEGIIAEDDYYRCLGVLSYEKELELAKRSEKQ